MTDRHIAHTESFEILFSENFGDKTVSLFMTYNAVVAYGYTAAFLTAVLERVQAEINAGRNVSTFFLEYSENAAFLMY